MLQGRRRPVVQVFFKEEVGNARADRNYPGIRKRYLKNDGADEWRNPGGGVLQKPLPAGFRSHVVPNVGGCAARIGRSRGIPCSYTHRERAYGEQNHKRPPALDPRPIRVCRMQHPLNSTGIIKHIRGNVCEQACRSVTNVIAWQYLVGWIGLELRLYTK